MKLLQHKGKSKHRFKTSKHKRKYFGTLPKEEDCNVEMIQRQQTRTQKTLKKEN